MSAYIRWVKQQVSLAVKIPKEIINLAQEKVYYMASAYPPNPEWPTVGYCLDLLRYNCEEPFYVRGSKTALDLLRNGHATNMYQGAFMIEEDLPLHGGFAVIVTNDGDR